MTVRMAYVWKEGLEVFRAKASIYALNENTKQWSDRGTSGTVVMFENGGNGEEVRIRWERGNQCIWWRLTSSKLKPKGERALVLKAFLDAQQEILAVRFSDQKSAIDFAQKYYAIFPGAQVGAPPVDSLFQSQGNGLNPFISLFLSLSLSLRTL